MSAAGRAKLRVVGTDERRDILKKRALTAEEEAEKQRRRDHWAQVHIAGDRAPPLSLPTLRLRRVIGSGTRTERGRLREI